MSLHLGYDKAVISVFWEEFSPGESAEKFASKLIQVGGRSQFLPIVGVTSPFPGWL